MTINIKNILDQVNTRLADSATSSSDIARLSNLSYDLDYYQGITQVQFRSDLPTADSSQIGKIFFVKDVGLVDSGGNYGTFYYGGADGWSRLSSNTDALSDSDYSSNKGIVIAPFLWKFQGDTAGYSAGGSSSWSTALSQITKIPVATGIPSSGFETLATAQWGGYSGQDRVAGNGYVFGGNTGSGNGQKWPFALGGQGSSAFTGQSAVAGTTHGGSWSTQTDAYLAVYAYGPANPQVAKMPFAADNAVANTGYNMFQGNGEKAATAVSTTHGYLAGGYYPSGYQNMIQKYSFANDANGTDVGNLTFNVAYQNHGQSSETNGYSSGGLGAAVHNQVNKWPFASDTDATNVASLVQARNRGANWSTTSYGHVSGGFTSPSVVGTTSQEKFPFATGTPVTGTALTLGLLYPHGVHN